MTNKADWRGALGAEWARRQAIMDRMLGPFGEDAAATLGGLRGKRVLDLGCGGGATTFLLARMAGAKGVALGVDVSPDLIALAQKRREAETGLAARAGFMLADAAEARFGCAFDALFSQFGAMFFEQPVAAYANLRRQMTPGAPLAIACWRAPKANGWAMRAFNAARHLLPEAAPVKKGAPGPFAWAAPEETFLPILARAGWRDVGYETSGRMLELGAGMDGATPVDRAIAFSMKIGPLASRLGALGDAAKDAVRDAVRAEFARDGDGPVVASGACWIVTARA